jgi:putative hydrolase of the HAD superfamily
VQHIKLKSAGLSDYFSTVIISEEHNLTKPDVAIFRLAERLSNAQMQECVIVGDNLESDIQGGKNAQWKTIFFGELSGKKEMVDYHIKDLFELKSLL